MAVTLQLLLSLAAIADAEAGCTSSCRCTGGKGLKQMCRLKSADRLQASYFASCWTHRPQLQAALQTCCYSIALTLQQAVVPAIVTSTLMALWSHVWQGC